MKKNIVESFLEYARDNGQEFAKRYPEIVNVMNMGDADWPDWEFNLTAACCGLAILLLEDEFSKANILTQAAMLDKNLPGAIQHLFDFIQKNAAEQALNHIVGIWVIVNLARELPDYEYIYRLAHVIGGLAVLIVEQEGIPVDKIEFN
ncbi:hypothetical protein KKC97_13365 [bacterium]|nr:hypothetical protein [bacterium]MBU1638646.1 hypothetical protein [bacterium]MBU1920936.1 hypothetical protein [bacterium]